ncbi:thiamine pyrophosphate-binding protein [Alkaliflexus imshenetskii]|uniref:thiamine pyrophosphate-binding protein n=1 Tax=Alkaliflexus imshenetskii TaxID=286730 RepID=UPI0004787BE1|nr:thiamine pyrophosphate-binding protein [Alkaliflexus imshenetskii]
MKKRAANMIIEQLVLHGVDYVFGVTGKAISPLIDALIDFDSIQFIATKHETGAALMAYGYAQGTGKIGVCCGTTGGGSTNLATGVATAFMNSIPLLVVTGQVSTFEFGKGAFQESTGQGQSINTVDFFKSISKASIFIDSVDNIREKIDHAIQLATTGRMGPVHINIPFNLQLAELPIPDVETSIATNHNKDNACFDSDVIEAVQLLVESINPVFLIGWGAVLSGAHRDIISIAERYDIPVATTIQGKGGIPSNHYLCLGIFGVCGHSMASDYIFEHADLVIAVGTTFGEFSTFNWDDRVVSNKKMIQIDIDHREIGKNYPVTLGINGDASVIARLLKVELERINPSPKNSGRQVEEMIDRIGRVINPHLMDSLQVPLKPQRVMKEIRDNTPDNTLFLADSGAHWAWAMHYLHVHHGGGFYPTLGLGSMGASICSSVGIKLAKPDHPVVCICGDGSFLMYGNEITTAGHYNVPVIWIILNDARYNLPSHSIKKMFDRTIGVDFREINFSKLAEVYGLKGYRIEKPGDLSIALQESLYLNSPVVIDVVIDPDEMPPLGRRKLTV